MSDQAYSLAGQAAFNSRNNHRQKTEESLKYFDFVNQRPIVYKKRQPSRISPETSRELFHRDFKPSGHELAAVGGINVIKPKNTSQDRAFGRQVLRQVILNSQEPSRPAVKEKKRLKRWIKSQNRLQLSLYGLAILIFLTGLAATLQVDLTNSRIDKRVASLAQAVAYKPTSKPIKASVPVPGTTKPSPSVVSSYTVGPNDPRYLNIPSIGVNKAIILNLGVLSSGALATPPNVFETGWYNQSSLPGQPGAMLIDGHVSSWTSKGVFYYLKDLKAGATISVTTGNGTVYNYTVVRSQTYSSTNVNMQSAVTPVNSSLPGLNLITCTGDVIPGTSTFSERVVVYAQLS